MWEHVVQARGRAGEGRPESTCWRCQRQLRGGCGQTCTKAPGTQGVLMAVQSEGFSSRKRDVGTCVAVWASRGTLRAWAGLMGIRLWEKGRELWPVLSGMGLVRPLSSRQGPQQQSCAPRPSPPSISSQPPGMRPEQGLWDLGPSTLCAQGRKRNLRSTRLAPVGGCGGQIASFASNRPRPDSYLRRFLAWPPGAACLTSLPHLGNGGGRGAWPRAGVGEALACRGPRPSKGLTATPFPAQVLAAEENVDFRIHVENQTRARDDVSRKQLRLYQLYSRTSGKHIQVLGRRISARGEDGDKYGRCPPPPAPAGTRFPSSETSGSDPSSARTWLCDLAPDTEPCRASVLTCEMGTQRRVPESLVGRANGRGDKKRLGW